MMTHWRRLVFPLQPHPSSHGLALPHNHESVSSYQIARRQGLSTVKASLGQKSCDGIFCTRQLYFSNQNTDNKMPKRKTVAEDVPQDVKMRDDDELSSSDDVRSRQQLARLYRLE